MCHAAELASLIQCHEALDGKSEGRSHLLSTIARTPILIPSGKKLYFITEKSIHVIENTFANKEVVFKIEDQQGVFFSKISFTKNGSVANLSFTDLSKEEKHTAIQPRANLGEASLSILKNELTKRMNSVSGEYQNKYNPQNTLDALAKCSNVKSNELQKSLAKQESFYRARLKKNNLNYKSTPTHQFK